MARPRFAASAVATRLSTRHKVTYGVGDVIIAMRSTCFQFYLLPFYTDVVVLAPWLAGLGKMLGLAWDGLNDPVTGYLSDRTRTRLGRRRPFMLGAALPLGLTFGFLWSPPAGLGPVAAFAYLVVTYVVLDTCFTLYATPYLALGAEMSADYHERTEIAATRALFHVLGLFAGGVLPGLVIGRYATEPAHGYAVMGFALGAAMAVVALLTGLLAPEPARAAAAPGAVSWRSFVGGLRETLRNRAFRVMLGTFALLLVGGAVHQSLVPYAFRYWLGRPDLVSSVIGVYLAASVASLPLWTRLSRRLGKDRALRLCMAWSVVALASLPVAFSPEMSTGRLTALLILAGLGNGGWGVLPTAIAADVIDQDELETAERREGAYFGVWTLAMKLAAALASGVVGVALQLLSYVPNAAQTPGTILGIKLLYGPVPALFLLAALLVFRRFPLTRERHREVQAALAARRGA